MLKHILLSFFLFTIYSGFSQSQSIDLQILVKEGGGKKVKRIVWFDKAKIVGEDITSEIEKSTILPIQIKEKTGILRVILSDVIHYEYLIHNPSNLVLTIFSDRVELSSGGQYAQHDLSVDSLLKANIYQQIDPIKKYLYPVSFVDYSKPKAFEKEQKIKQEALIDAKKYFPKAKKMVDSLRNLGQLTPIVADFYQNKFALQEHQLALLEGEYSEAQMTQIVRDFTAQNNEFVDRYLYKFVELVVKKIIVEPAPKMSFKDGINRDYREIYDKIEKSDFLSDYFKKHLKLYYLKGIVYSFPKEVALPYYELYLKTVQDDGLIEIAKSDNYLKLFPETQSELQSFDSKAVNLKDLAAGHRFTYIDFWASWCAPCRAEMPASKNLKADFQSRNIGFVYLSMDDNPVAWKRAVSQIGLEEQECYLLSQGLSSQVAKKYGIISIPRYMIMDKDGVIIYQKTLRPSDAKIRALFEKLLKK